MVSRPSWNEKTSKDILKQCNISIKDYIDSITTPGTAIDLLAVFILARLYQVHFRIFMHGELWLSCKEHNTEKYTFFLVYRGETAFSEICKIGQSDLYLDSLIKQTAAGNMQSHADESKLGSVSQDEEEYQEERDQEAALNLAD